MNEELLERSLQVSSDIGLDIGIVRKIGLHEGSSNLVYLVNFNSNPAVLKIFRKDGPRKIAKEKALGKILSEMGMKTPQLYYDYAANPPFIIEEYLDGECPTNQESLLLRSTNCANLHIKTVGQSNEQIEHYTDHKRAVLMRQLLRGIHFIGMPIKFASLIENQIFLVENVPFCCTFYDFVPSNSRTKSSDPSLYYFDFERTRFTAPFFDPACLVLYRKEDLDHICESYHRAITSSDGVYSKLSHLEVRRGVLGAAVEKCIEILSFFQYNQHVDQSVREYVIEKYRTNLIFLLDRIDKDLDYNVKYTPAIKNDTKKI